jgi:hypothetical protein
MASLTPVQQRILSEMEPGRFYDAYKLCKQRRTRMALNNGGWTEPDRTGGAITSFWKIRLTAKGMTAKVRALDDQALLAAYNVLASDACDPWSEAILGEIQRRNLDL